MQKQKEKKHPKAKVNEERSSVPEEQLSKLYRSCKWRAKRYGNRLLRLCSREMTYGQ
jgi:hypothetical protein